MIDNEREAHIALASILGLEQGASWDSIVRSAKVARSIAVAVEYERDPVRTWSEENMNRFVEKTKDLSALIAYRNMKATESIAESLLKLANPLVEVRS